MDNARIAKEEHIPICQDTGHAVIFMKIGQDVHFTAAACGKQSIAAVPGDMKKAFCASRVVSDPLFARVNTKNNAPAILYTELIEGDGVEIVVGAKGFGSENMSTITMLKPAQGIEGVKACVLSAIQKAGPNACPPMVVGVGIGGTFDYAACWPRSRIA